MALFRAAVLFATLSGLAVAQYLSPPTFDHVVTVPSNPNITVSFNQPTDDICATKLPSQKQFTGYVSFPPQTLAPVQQNYSFNYFFWFVEARDSPETAPFTIWLNGGPGASSLVSFFYGNGPCEVIRLEDGSYGTQPNLWGWDRLSNMLYIDQPSNVGLSYSDPLQNVSSATLIRDMTESSSESPPTDQLTYYDATFGNRAPFASANTTKIAAIATWHMLQGFFGAFPQYQPTTNGINIHSISYGGHYAPTFASYFTNHSIAMDKSSANGSVIGLRVDSVGVWNGMVDDLVQYPYYPLFLYNNTYTDSGLHLLSQTQELNGLSELTNYCIPKLQRCAAATLRQPSAQYGNNPYVGSICYQALDYCHRAVFAPPLSAGFSAYDIREPYSEDEPSALVEFLNYAEVQKAIGAAVNYTNENSQILDIFQFNGDESRPGQMENLAFLLENDVRVALVYGDADYICNWYGGQAVAFALANSIPNYARGFAQAGYADIVVNDSYVGGAVRQYGNLSFSRIYDAGHSVDFDQPETAFQVFARIVNGTSLSMGQPINLQTFASNGTQNATHTNRGFAASESPQPTCWIRNIHKTCSSAQIEQIKQGQGVVKHGIWHSNDELYASALSSTTASSTAAERTVSGDSL